MVDDGVGGGAGQVEATHPGSDGGVEGELPCADRGGGAGGDGQRRRRGELAAETRRFVVYVIPTSVILVGGKEQLQGPEEEKTQYVSK